MSAELTAPFVFKDEAKRLVFGPVLIPDEPDTDGDVVSAEKIEEVAYKFAEDYGNIDLMHSLQNVGKMVETYIARTDMEYEMDGERMFVPKGSWMLGVRITDDAVWESVQKGELGGFSIMGIPAAEKGQAQKNATEKRTTLEDLGDDWIVNAVSLVDKPAVPKAKFVAVKSQDEPDKGLLARIAEKLGVTSEKAGRTVSDANFNRLKQIKEQIDELYELAENERSKTKKKEGADVDEARVKELIDEQMKPINKSLESIKELLGKKDDSDSDKGGDGDEHESKDAEDKKADDKSQDDDKKRNVTDEEILSRLEALEAAQATAGKSQGKINPYAMFKGLVGQDGDDDDKDNAVKYDRDPFGRKVKKSE